MARVDYDDYDDDDAPENPHREPRHLPSEKLRTDIERKAADKKRDKDWERRRKEKQGDI